jgi:rRNA biogenesis protein RRP5
MCIYVYRSGDSPAAKALLSRSMQSLSKHKHIEVLIKYAGCEFDDGSADRGRSVFEVYIHIYIYIYIYIYIFLSIYIHICIYT